MGGEAAAPLGENEHQPLNGVSGARIADSILTRISATNDINDAIQ